MSGREGQRIACALTVLALVGLSLVGASLARASSARPAAGELVLRGRQANNTFVIRATGTDSGSYSIDGGRPERFSGIRSLTIDGVGGHDVCRIVNPPHGLFAPPSGIACNGGNAPGHPRRGVLELVGGAASSSNYAPGRPGAGTMTHRLGHISQLIRFTGMAPVIDTVPEPSLMFTDSSPDDGVELVNGPSAGDLTIESADDDFESLTFSNKTDVTIDATASGDQGLLNTTQSATDLSALTFNVDGNITSDQADLSGVDVTLNSSDGDITQGSGGALNASSLALSADLGIGTSSQPLQLDGPANLAFTNTTGAVNISSSGELTIGAVGSLGDSSNAGTTTTLSSSGPLEFSVNATSAGSLSATTDSDDNLTEDSGVTLESTSGNLSLSVGAGGALILHGSLQAPNGTITPGYPSASITTPGNGAYYLHGQTVTSSFTCTDGNGGPGIATCLDQNGNPAGQAIDTSTVGSHTFAVTATSDDYLTQTSSVTYNVASLPSVTITTPANGATYAQGQGVSSKFTCIDGPGGPGIASCVDGNDNPSGTALDTLTPGQHTFTATATSGDGFTSSESVTYTVTAAPNVTTTVPAAPSPPSTVPTTPSAAPPTVPGVTSSSAAAFPEPALSDLRIRPHAFHAASRGRAVAAGSEFGATVTYSDSLAADTRFAVYRELPGARRGRRCVRVRRGQHRGVGRHCTRRVFVGSFKHQDQVGADRLRFTGRIAGHALPPGSYVLKAAAKLAGQISQTVSAPFVILPSR